MQPQGPGVLYTAPSEQTASVLMPMSTPTMGAPIGVGGGSGVLTAMQAYQWPASRVTVASATTPANRSSSLVRIQPILGSRTALPSTLMAPGPLSARNEQWVARLWNLGKPTCRGLGIPAALPPASHAFFALRYSAIQNLT